MKIGNTKNSWSKWGGIGSRLLKIDEDWSCQACGMKMPAAMDPFLIPFGVESIVNEYMRLCPFCYHEAKLQELDFFELIRVVRK